MTSLTGVHTANARARRAISSSRTPRRRSWPSSAPWYIYPFNAACAPLHYSGNPGVNGVFHRGGVRQEQAAQHAAPAPGSQLHVRGIGVSGWDGTTEGVGRYEHSAAIVFWIHFAVLCCIMQSNWYSLVFTPEWDQVRALRRPGRAFCAVRGVSAGDDSPSNPR